MTWIPKRDVVPALSLLFGAAGGVLRADWSRPPRADRRRTSRLKLAESSKIFSGDGTLITTLPRRSRTARSSPSRRFPSTSRTPSSRSRTSASTSTRASTSRRSSERCVANIGQRRDRGGWLDDHPAVREEHDHRSRRDTPRRPTSERSTKRLSLASSRRSSPRRRSSSATSTPSTSGRARTASRPPPRRTSTSRPRSSRLSRARVLAGVIRSPETYDPFDQPRSAPRSAATSSSRRWRSSATSTRCSRSERQKKGIGARPRRDRRTSTRPPTSSTTSSASSSTTLASRPSAKTPEQREQQMFQGGLRIYTTVDLDVQAGCRERGHRQSSPYERRPARIARRDRSEQRIRQGDGRRPRLLRHAGKRTSSRS